MMRPFGFYAVLTDPVRGYDYCTQLMVDHKIAFVQLRMKDVPLRTVVETAERMRKITSGTDTKLIINDTPDIAKAVHADGVHIGQGDMPYLKAREIVGPDAIIGISTHSQAQMLSACALSPQYVGMGPVYATPTKKNPDPTIGLEGMKRMLSSASVPAVAIGGITLENLRLVLAAGAKNFCMVRPITQSQNPRRILKEVLAVSADYLG